MLATLRQWSTITAAIIAAIAGGLMCLSPLLGAPGIESALVLGLLLPPFCGALGARVVVRLRGDEDDDAEPIVVPASRVLADVVFGALFVLAIPATILALDMLRVPICDPVEGVGFLLLGPAIGVVLAAVTGALVSLIVPWKKIATAIAVVIPLIAALVELALFYSTPSIYSYGHFSGYFPGTLYDPDIEITLVYATYRVVSIAWILTLSALFTCFWDPRSMRASIGVALERWRLLLGAIGGLTLVVLACVFGPAFGHRSSAASIQEELGGTIVTDRCLIVFPREMPRRDAERLGDDCDFRVERSEDVLGVRQRARVTAFFFRNADEKRRLMGASNTYIAKPWRNEVYLQVGGWPHEVLFHEIVHVVAGNVGTGPFRVSTSALGLVPEPAIIEGIAVAAAWEPRDGMTPHQWARAMLDEDLAPPLEDVVGLGFLLQPASRAYTLSGSFVRWIRDTEGEDAVRRLYLTGDFEEALGRPLARAERDWHRFLRTEVELPPEARALAQLRFTQPGIFGQICPHRIAKLEEELADDLAAGDDHAALRTCRSILSLDRGQANIRAAYAGTLARLGRDQRAERELRTLIGPPAAAPPTISAARRELGDAHWMRGDSARALEIFRDLMDEPMSEEEKRQIEVRVLAIETGGAGERALRGLLAPRRDSTEDAAVSLAHIAALSRARPDGLAAYLEARQLVMRQRFELATPRIRDARRLGLPTPRVIEEARRLEAVSSFGSGDIAASRSLWREIARDPASTDADRTEAADWLARIRFAERATRLARRAARPERSVAPADPQPADPQPADPAPDPVR
jgi:hypothetical protein